MVVAYLRKLEEPGLEGLARLDRRWCHCSVGELDGSGVDAAWQC